VARLVTYYIEYGSDLLKEMNFPRIAVEDRTGDPGQEVLVNRANQVSLLIDSARGSSFRAGIA
jgi:hypothetical protein